MPDTLILNIHTKPLFTLMEIDLAKSPGAGRFIVQGGGVSHALASLLLAAAAVHLFAVLFRKAVSPSEILSFLLFVGALILWR